MWNGQILKTNKNCAKEKKISPFGYLRNHLGSARRIIFLPKFVLHMETVDLQHIIFENMYSVFHGLFKISISLNKSTSQMMLI